MSLFCLQPHPDNSKKRGHGTELARGRRVSAPPFGMIEIFPNGGAPSPCGLSVTTGAAGVIVRPGAPGAAQEAPGGNGPIIGVTLNRACSRPNWYITSATRWILTLSMAVG